MAEEKMPQGSICWSELLTRDIAAAKKFYTELIGWKVTEETAGGRPYSMVTPPGSEQAVAGMMEMAGPEFEGVPAHWMTYIAVDDIDATARRCTELGGKVHHPPTDIPDIGRFCVIGDPTGAVVALFQAGQS
jgi:hypothetical protein